jgi:hemoglobin
MQTSHQITREEINSLVDRFYAKVRLDPEIGPIFNAAIDDWSAHLTLLKDFWSTVLLPERSYKGDPLSKHLELSLDPAHFARWLTLFAETARETMPPEHADLIIGKSHRIAENFKAAIAYKRGEAPPLSIFRAPTTKP